MAASYSGSRPDRDSRPGKNKPERGQCSRCTSDDLHFYDDGRGECNGCGYRFWWDRGPKGRVAVNRPDRRSRDSESRERERERGRDEDAARRGDYDDDKYDGPARHGPGGRYWGVGDPYHSSGTPDSEEAERRGGGRGEGGAGGGRKSGSGPMDWEEDFDMEDDYNIEDELEDDEETGGKKKKGKRFEIRIGQPTVTGVEADGEDMPVVEPLSDKDVRAAGIPKEMRERLRALEHQMKEINEKLDALKNSLDNMEGRVTNLDTALDKQSALLGEMEDVRDGFVKVEATVNELSAIYDLVSAQINPFIDMGGYPRAGEVDEDLEGVVDWDLDGDEDEDIPGSSVKNPFVDDDMGGAGEEGEGEDGAGGDTGEAAVEGGAPSADAKHPLAIENIQRLAPQKWLMKWTEFLLTKVGPEDLPLLLDYYKDLGWIDDMIVQKVMAYLSGVKGVEPVSRPAVGGVDMLVGEDGLKVPDKDGWKLDMEDHTRSLEFLEFIRNESAGRPPGSAAPAGTGKE